MKDKIRLNVRGGGVFSKMMLAMQNIAKFEYGLENCYLNIADRRALGVGDSNPLDFVLEQTYGESYLFIECKPLAPYTNLSRVEDSEDYLNLKKEASKLKYKQILRVLLDDYTYLYSINSNTLGVHIRLCDMNIAHKTDYGVVNFNDYVKAIQKELEYSDTNVFVASDNEESILKLRAIFGSRISYVPNLIRAKTETEDSSLLQLQNFNNVKFWQEAFLEMLLLSKCSKLICRTSNLANMAIISSNTIKKTIML